MIVNAIYIIVIMIGMIVVHELGHIFAYFFLKKEWPDVKINGINVSIPVDKLAYSDKISVFISGIIAGFLFLFIISDWNILGYYGMMVMYILYTIGCGHDILQLLIMLKKRAIEIEDEEY